jgi:spore germination protein YaaH
VKRSRARKRRARARRSCLSALALLAVVASSAQAASTRVGHRVGLQAFLLSSAPDSIVDLRAHAGSIHVVYPTYFNCEIPSGRITGADIPAITDYARARDIAVMPRFNCQDAATVHQILTVAHTRAATLARLAAIARNPFYGGLSLDLENDGGEDREALSTFVAALARTLHAHHKKLSVVVDGLSGEEPAAAAGLYDYRALSAAADSVFVLAWGAHWAGSAPGPIAPLAQAEAVARYISSLPHASRFVLGAPMYGLDWAEGAPASQATAYASQATAYEYSGIVALARSVGATPSRDSASQEMTFSYTAAGVTHRVWYLDAHAVLALLRIGRAHGLAVGVWRLGGEDQRLWSSSLLMG